MNTIVPQHLLYEDYPRFAREIGFDVPNDFWNFWMMYYYGDESSRRILEKIPSYKMYDKLLLRFLDVHYQTSLL